MMCATSLPTVWCIVFSKLSQPPRSIATIYASQHMSIFDRECFFADTGHSETVSKENYQTDYHNKCPAAVTEMEVTGHMLEHLHSGNYKVA